LFLFRDNQFLEMSNKPTYEQLAQRVQVLERESLKRIEAEDRSENAVSILRATPEATPDGIVAVNRHGRVASVNQRFQDLCRIPESIMAAKDDNRVLGHIVDQVKDPKTFLQKVGATLKKCLELTLESLQKNLNWGA
jgi:PAS domain-containing protein